MTTIFNDDESALGELVKAADGDELCRLLLESPWGWGSSTEHQEAVELLERVHGRGTLGDELVAMLLCTCRRWDRVTTKLIAALEDSGLLSDAALNGLAASFLTDEVIVEYPLAWISLDWLEVDLDDLSTRQAAVHADTLATSRSRPKPPLRRWAAARTLTADPNQVKDLIAAADRLSPRHSDAIIHGLLDACDVLAPGDTRRVVGRGLRTGQGRVRRCALHRLCQLDGPDAARRRARSDADATVRSWRPPSQTALQLI